jgi:hypothetical protein
MCDQLYKLNQMCDQLYKLNQTWMEMQGSSMDRRRFFVAECGVVASSLMATATSIRPVP